MQITPKWIKDKRKEAGMTQEEFGRALNVSRFAVSGWEKGHHAIPEDIATRIIASSIRPATVDVSAPILPKTHPECFIEHGNRTHYSLAHPRWYIDSPLAHLAPEALRFGPAAPVSELATHVAPTMETIVELLLQNWPDAAALARYPNNGWVYEVKCKDFLIMHGRSDLLHLIPHDSTNDLVERQPDTSPANPAPELVARFNSAFNLNQS